MSSEPVTDTVSLAPASSESKGKQPERGGQGVAEPPSDFKVWNPPAGELPASTPALPDSYFEPTTTELKASYQAQVRAREALVNAPLKTREVREREAKSKLARWPTTTIRVKFPDRTQLEKTFPSTDKIRAVYAFVRNSLRDDVQPHKFVLYQAPPRREFKVSDPKVRDLNLFELQLAPSSVLSLGFQDDSLNDIKLRAPLLESILAQAQDLPPPPKFDEAPLPDSDGKAPRKSSTGAPKDSGSKSVPKWFKIGQKK